MNPPLRRCENGIEVQRSLESRIEGEIYISKDINFLSRQTNREKWEWVWNHLFPHKYPLPRSIPKSSADRCERAEGVRGWNGEGRGERQRAIIASHVLIFLSARGVGRERVETSKLAGSKTEKNGENLEGDTVEYCLGQTSILPVDDRFAN